MNKPDQQKRVPQFSLLALLFLLSMAAAYWAGWASHRAWNRRNFAETRQRLIDELQTKLPVKIETIEGTDVFMTRGKADDVETATAILQEASEAALK